ncbi:MULTISPECIES: acetate/propionate family kinase [Mesorhizobium]|uniref:Acetate kinase n=1 Tax=Mesorhizobium denitrificans TaxID=2294114 RepID=A0A371X660_9HYPH|nr:MULTISPECIES: acetate/propionate family kinase [Mesorhizobium]RFC64699.1 acetate/propionate family kinase [Mesorhizobium denitrificans]
MRTLVFNAGSSSLKFGVFDVASDTREVFKGSFERFREGMCDFRFRCGKADQRGSASHASIDEAIAAIPGVLKQFGLAAPDAIGHRVAHGGSTFIAPAILEDAIVVKIEDLSPLAPLHNPANLEAIKLCRALWPAVPQVAVFDTSFHLTNPTFATTYAVPEAWRRAGLRRYGFHGTSHKYVALRAAEETGQPLSNLQIVSVHLGNGASVCAVNRGRSMDSSMGITPLEGLVMGTRSGDLDPGAFGFLARQLSLSVADIETALYNDSGLKGLAGSSDMRDIEDRAAAGDAQAQLAIEIYAYRARKYVGAYAAAMGGIDALVFTGGIGENSASMRRRICDGLAFMGLQLDLDRNAAPDLSGRAAPQIQAYGSRVCVFVTETAEQLMIARETAQALARVAPAVETIPVAVSGRHVHLSREAADALFGKGYELTPAKPLRQPGHWAARERVTLEGPKGRLENVAILGPLRMRTQAEISRTDSFVLGIDVPVRESGKLDGTPSVTVVGPAGTFASDGLIVSARHIHTNPHDAARLGLTDGELIDVYVGDGPRRVTFAQTLVRVGETSFTEMHIDTDEANAAGIGACAEGEIVPGHAATLRS